MSTRPLASWAGLRRTCTVAQLSRGRSRRQIWAHHHRRLGAGCASGHLREEAHALAKRPRLDLEEGAGVARLPALEGILLDLVDDGAAGLASRCWNVLRPVAGDFEGEAVPHGLAEFHQLAAPVARSD